MDHDQDLALELVSASRRAAEVSRGIATASRKMSEDTRRQVIQTCQKIRESFAYLHSTNASYWKLTGFLKGGNGIGRHPNGKINTTKSE